MKAFRNFVKLKEERKGWTVLRIVPHTNTDHRPPVDYLCFRGGYKMLIRARGNGHGHLYKKEREELLALKAKSSIRVVWAHLNAANEIILTAI